MKDYFNCGRLIDSFCVLPLINITWMRKTNTTPTSWEISFALFFWYISIGNIKINLKKSGYY